MLWYSIVNVQVSLIPRSWHNSLRDNTLWCSETVGTLPYALHSRRRTTYTTHHVSCATYTFHMKSILNAHSLWSFGFHSTKLAISGHGLDDMACARGRKHGSPQSLIGKLNLSCDVIVVNHFFSHQVTAFEWAHIKNNHLIGKLPKVISKVGNCVKSSLKSKVISKV